MIIIDFFEFSIINFIKKHFLNEQYQLLMISLEIKKATFRLLIAQKIKISCGFEKCGPSSMRCIILNLYYRYNFEKKSVF